MALDDLGIEGAQFCIGGYLLELAEQALKNENALVSI